MKNWCGPWIAFVKLFFMKKYALTSLLAALLMGGCAEDRTPVTTLQTEVEHIHDEAMKQMGPMNALARQLKQEMAALPEGSPRRDSVQQAIDYIGKAEKDMMDWMKGYKAPEEKTSVKEALEYLQKEKTAIEQNGKDIQAATDQGLRLLSAPK